MATSAAPVSGPGWVTLMPEVPTVALALPSPPATFVTCSGDSVSPAPAFTGFVSSMGIFLRLLAVELRFERTGRDRARGIARIVRRFDGGRRDRSGFVRRATGDRRDFIGGDHRAAPAMRGCEAPAGFYGALHRLELDVPRFPVAERIVRVDGDGLRERRRVRDRRDDRDVRAAGLSSGDSRQVLPFDFLHRFLLASSVAG